MKHTRPKNHEPTMHVRRPKEAVLAFKEMASPAATAIRKNVLSIKHLQNLNYKVE